MRASMASSSLQDFIEEANAGSHLRVEHDFGGGYVRLRTSEAERRQAAQDIQCSENVVLELLRNSRDAHAKHVFLATAREGTIRSITVIDDGDGVPENMHDHIFEPRVTSKLDTSHRDAWGLHGRGMALFSIAENAKGAHVAASAPELGCAIHVETDTTTLPEKTDQSGFPRFLQDEDGTVRIRGPRNILRTACEFAIEARDACRVFVGSPAEIAATLYRYGQATLSAIDRAFCRDESELPLVKRLSTASDPDDFANMATSFGIRISSRTARRVLDGQVADVDDLLSLISIEGAQTQSARTHRRATATLPGVKIQRAEAIELASELRESFAQLAERYYLEKDVEPRVSVGRDRITITLPLVSKAGSTL